MSRPLPAAVVAREKTVMKVAGMYVRGIHWKTLEDIGRHWKTLEDIGRQERERERDE